MKYIIKKEVRLNSIWVVLLAILIVTNFYSCTNRGIVLVDNGVSNYEIVTRENATEKEQYAAKELQNYLEKISTVNFSIVHENSMTENKNKVFVTKLNLHPQKIQIKTDGADIFISGGSDAAVKNAVYEFLELYLNCKWYAPNVEEIPVSKSILLAKDINYSYNPSITTRTVHSRLFYENPVFAEKHKVTSEAFPFYVKDARVHTFHKFVPEEKYYNDHPEYFALRGDKRLPTQLCLTNENVYEIVRASVSSFFEQNPEARVISVSQNDNQQYCQCDDCSRIDKEEGGPTGTMIQFVNKIAADFPDKTISTLAYQYTRKPSKTKPLKNVLITLCSIECDRSAPIEEKCTDFAEDLKGWREISNTIRIWDYTTQFTNFLAPFPNMHTLQPNIKFFRDNNAKWIFEQHSNNPSELFELRSYVMAKLLWNPDASVEEIITEFTEGYYKEAGVYVRKYIDLIHKKIVEDNDFFLFLYGDPSQAFSSYLNHELLDQYTSFFDDAENAVSYNSEMVERVRVARLSIDYTILEACRRGLTEKYRLIVKDEQGKISANPIVVEKLDKIYTTCNKATITLMNEMGFTVEEYYINYKKAMEVAVKPNKAIGKKSNTKHNT